MAEEKTETETSEQSSSSKLGFLQPLLKNRRLLLIVGAGTALVLLSVLGTLYLLGVFDSRPGAEVPAVAEEEAVEQTEQAVDGPALYFPIKPPLIVNFQARGRQRFLQASITLMARDAEAISAVQTHMPLIRNELNMLYSGQVYEELQTDEGREQLRQLSLEAIQQVMRKEIGRPGVEQVLFTNLVMQ